MGGVSVATRRAVFRFMLVGYWAVGSSPDASPPLSELLLSSCPIFPPFPSGRVCAHHDAAIFCWWELLSKYSYAHDLIGQNPQGPGEWARSHNPYPYMEARNGCIGILCRPDVLRASPTPNIFVSQAQREPGPLFWLRWYQHSHGLFCSPSTSRV